MEDRRVTAVDPEQMRRAREAMLAIVTLKMKGGGPEETLDLAAASGVFEVLDDPELRGALVAAFAGLVQSLVIVIADHSVGNKTPAEIWSIACRQYARDAEAR